MNEEELGDQLHEFLVKCMSPIANVLIQYGAVLTMEEDIVFEAKLTNGKTMQLIYKD